MADETKELDAKLRERGSRKLRDELDTLFKPLVDRVSGASSSVLTLEHAIEGSKVEPPETAADAIDAIRGALERHLEPIYQQQEVDAFISRVDGLKAQIDELDPRT